MERAHHIRITSHGKMRTWVEFALNHLKVSCWLEYVRPTMNSSQNDSEIPLSLHTLPNYSNKSTEAVNPQKIEKERGLSPSTTTIPRLLSVVEIIKREYLATLGSTSLRGLHQYNEIGCFDQDKSTAKDARTQTTLAVALEGKNQ